MDQAYKKEIEAQTVMDYRNVNLQYYDGPLDMRITTANQIIKLKKNKEYIIEDFILPSTINMLYSNPAGYKSLVSLYLAMCVAEGTNFLQLKTKKQKVLILDLENNVNEIRNRLVSLRNGHNLKRKKLFKNIFFINYIDLFNSQEAQELTKFIATEQIGLIIIDTIRRVGNFQENSSDDINRIYQTMKAITTENLIHNPAILFLHHTRKESNMYRGSIDLLGFVDTAYNIIPYGRKEGEILIKKEKSRFGGIEQIGLIINWDKNKETTKITQMLTFDKVEEQIDRYQQFNRAKAWLIQYLTRTTMYGSTIRRIDIMNEYQDTLNADDAFRATAFSKRTLDSAIRYLISQKYLRKTEKAGVFLRNFKVENQTPTLPENPNI